MVGAKVQNVDVGGELTRRRIARALALRINRKDGD
jgi:hypothetical protein